MEEADTQSVFLQRAAEVHCALKLGKMADASLIEFDRRTRRMYREIKQLFEEGRISTMNPAEFTVSDIHVHLTHRREEPNILNGKPRSETEHKHEVVALRHMVSYPVITTADSKEHVHVNNNVDAAFHSINTYAHVTTKSVRRRSPRKRTSRSWNVPKRYRPRTSEHSEPSRWSP